MAIAIRSIEEAREMARSIGDELGLTYDQNCLQAHRFLSGSREEHVARVIANRRKWNRGAGKRALIAKVGYDRACQITGHTLQG